MAHTVATLALPPSRLGSAHRKPRWRAVRTLRVLVTLLLGIVWLLLKPPSGAFAAGVVGAGTAESSGRLRLVQVLENGKEGVEGLLGAWSVAVSPEDGANVYVSSLGDALAVFARDTQSGRLTFLEAQRNGVNGVDGLGSSFALAMSPDGAHVYVASYGSSAITVFACAPLTGQLTFVQAQRDGLPGPDLSMLGLAVSPDGAHVYVSGLGQKNDVAVFARDASSGKLTPVEVVSYRSCSAGVQVGLCSIEASQVSAAAGHNLYLNPDLDVARTAWEFLSRFRLPAQ
jgi:hypothetical protein